MTKSAAEKMGIKQNARTIFVNAPADVIDAIELPDVNLETKLAGAFDYIHLFVISQADFHEEFPQVKDHLRQTGNLWVSWPKAGQKKSDLNIKGVIRLGYEYGLVESKCISIDSVWSALKFTHPKEGKRYNNSYGKLKTS